MIQQGYLVQPVTNYSYTNTHATNIHPIGNSCYGYNSVFNPFSTKDRPLNKNLIRIYAGLVDNLGNHGVHKESRDKKEDKEQE
jgi:hypothetical protein